MAFDLYIKQRFSEDDRRIGLAFLAAHKSNTRKAAKETGIPQSVLRFWSEQEEARENDPPETADLIRPFPPSELTDPDADTCPLLFVPAYDVERWVRAALFDEAGPFYNPEHWHLTQARIGFLWTNAPNEKAGKRRVGEAELVGTRGGKWQTARDWLLLKLWFGDLPDFVITLDAPYCAQASDATFYSLIDHELLHCSFQLDRDGDIKETPDGDPIWALRAHDVEEFVSCVRRWGEDAAAGNTIDLIAAALDPPEFDLL